MALTDKLSAIADAIRERTGKSNKLTLSEMPDEIRSISGGGGSSVNPINIKMSTIPVDTGSTYKDYLLIDTYSYRQHARTDFPKIPLSEIESFTIKNGSYLKARKNLSSDASNWLYIDIYGYDENDNLVGVYHNSVTASSTSESTRTLNDVVIDFASKNVVYIGCAVVQTGTTTKSAKYYFKFNLDFEIKLK